jgi:hypothetical protein
MRRLAANDEGNLRPFCIVVKAINLSASNDRDNLVGLRIGDEALCHVSLGATRWDATTQTVARKDYDDRRRRQAHGVAKAKAAGAYRGRPEDIDRNAGIAGMLRSGMSWTAIQAATGCSRATIAKVRARAP